MVFHEICDLSVDFWRLSKKGGRRQGKLAALSENWKFPGRMAFSWESFLCCPTILAFLLFHPENEIHALNRGVVLNVFCKYLNMNCITFPDGKLCDFDFCCGFHFMSGVFPFPFNQGRKFLPISRKLQQQKTPWYQTFIVMKLLRIKKLLQVNVLWHWKNTFYTLVSSDRSSLRDDALNTPPPTFSDFEIYVFRKWKWKTFFFNDTKIHVDFS